MPRLVSVGQGVGPSWGDSTMEPKFDQKKTPSIFKAFGINVSANEGYEQTKIKNLRSWNKGMYIQGM